MAYISELVGRPVTDVEGERIGSMEEVIGQQSQDLPHPRIAAIGVKQAGKLTFIPIDTVAVLLAPVIPLNCLHKEVVPYQPGEQDIYLVRDVLDKQIIDTDGVRVVRVNDLELARVNNVFYLANVDISGVGLLRRLGLGGLARNLPKRIQNRLPINIISWDNVEVLSPDQQMRLKVSSEKISDLHPADLAEIISDLNRQQSGKFLESLDVKTLADTLEEVEPDFQASLIENIPDERMADVLEEMAPDEAADLLGELPKDRSQELLMLMEDEEAEDVRKLMEYPVDSAGGLMTPDYISIHPDLSAEKAISVLRETASEAETIFYVYVTEEDERLVGVLSLKDLVLAKPNTPIREFMHRRLVSVSPLDSQEKVAQAIAKYNLLAVPVVDDNDRMQGIVTSDDALDKIIPTAWKKRLPRMYR
jgi:magnesium transporter